MTEQEHTPPSTTELAAIKARLSNTTQLSSSQFDALRTWYEVDVARLLAEVARLQEAERRLQVERDVVAAYSHQDPREFPFFSSVDASRVLGLTGNWPEQFNQLLEGAIQRGRRIVEGSKQDE